MERADGTLSDRGTRVLAVWAAVLLPAILANGTVGEVTMQHPITAPAAPFVLFELSPLATLVAPLVILSAIVLFVTPGLLAVAALRATNPLRFDVWLLYGFGASVIMVSLPLELMEAVSPFAPRGTGFSLYVVAIALAVLGVAARRGGIRRLVAACPLTPRDVSSVVLPTLAITVALVPKLFWESFNGDGAHAFEAARRLLSQAVPFFDAGAGAISGFPGTTSMLFAYPGSWFIRLFGEFEAAARAPFLLYLPLTAAGIAALSAVSAERSRLVRTWVWAGLVPYAIVMAFSATYGAFAADLSLPATQDTLLVVAFLGFALAARRAEWAWVALFAVFTITSLPTGVVLIGFWWLARAALERPLPSGDLARSAVLVATVVAVVLAFGPILGVLGMPTPGGEYGAESIVEQVTLLRLFEPQRMLFLLLGAGIAPALSLLAWKQADGEARVFTLTALAYFVFFLFQAEVALHHFVPAMLLPLVVLWRADATSRGRIRVGVAGLALLACVLVSPATWTVHTRAKEVGSALAVSESGYDRSAPEAFASVGLMFELFARPGDPAVPDQSYGDSPLSWNYYAHRARRHPRSTQATAYMLVPAGEVRPNGRMVDSLNGMTLLVINEAIWQAQRRPPGPPTISPLLAIDRDVLFNRDGEVRDLLGFIRGRLPQ